ncbi:MAG: molybdopterin biosynthesis protein [Anaerolineales bacterium]|jgi:putative molybdopterin biosynthesis protein
MSVYLHDIPLDEAKARFKAALKEAQLWSILGQETIPLDENALGRVLTEPILAKVSSPHYHAAAMDGFVVRAYQTLGAQPSRPRVLHIGNQARYIDTGDPIPEGFDSVIPIENVESLDEAGKIAKDIRLPDSIRIRAAVAPWSQIRMMGEDIIVTQFVLAAGQVIRPVDLGAVAAAGYREIQVARRPRVAILPTGTELVPIGSELKPGFILEYNSLVLAAQVHSWGGLATRLPIIPDDFEAICGRVQEIAPDFDLILMSAGSSAGAEDFSAKVVAKLGTLLVHGVAVRPGHPVILGMLNADNRRVPVIGVPGYPVSSAMTGEIFVEPLLAKWTGRRAKEMPVEMAELTRKITSTAGDDDYIRVALGKVGERMLAAPLARGAGIITSLVRADGLVVLPQGVQGAEAGELVPVLLYSERWDIERTIFCIGSHDLSLDLLAQFLVKRDRRLTSANVGSQGGLLALQRGVAHLAGSHLLDPETGEYNVTYLPKYLPGIPVKLVALVLREQGLMVKKGNPKNIKNLRDISKPGIRYVNRQRSAGTRVLLDYHLSLEGISPESIQGYHQEEYTHLGVAAAVASERADCGLGIAAAAQALDLDFLPLFQERYDLVIPKEHATSPLLAPLFDIIAGKEFRSAVMAMPGYDVSVMGKLILET